MSVLQIILIVFMVAGFPFGMWLADRVFNSIER